MITPSMRRQSSSVERLTMSFKEECKTLVLELGKLTTENIRLTAERVRLRKAHGGEQSAHGRKLPAPEGFRPRTDSDTVIALDLDA